MSILKKKTALTCINIESNGIAVVQINQSKENSDALPVITQCLFRTLKNENDIKSTLQSLNIELSLKRSRCTTVLSSQYYKLLLTDKPKVPDNELVAALRWQVKDMIDKPIDETTFEVFSAPITADNSIPEPAYILAADNIAIQQRADLMAEAKINLHSIDIHEMALRNLIMLLPDAGQPTVLLWLDKEYGTLIIVRDAAIYMCRSIPIGLNSFSTEMNNEQENDSLMLEIQRSLDFYESRYQSAPIRNIYLAPGITDCAPSLAASIQQTLGIESQVFNLDDYIEYHSESMPDHWQATHFIGIGAALRREEAAA